MKRLYIIARYIVIFAVVLSVKSYAALAQQSSPNQWRSIRTHNVRADIMAYFIDAEHQKTPIEFSIPSRTEPDYSLEKFLTATTAGAPELTFNGTLAVDESQNTIWVLSDQNTFDQTQRFVDFMDRPLVQCELDLQVVKISKEDLASFKTSPLPAETHSNSVAPAPYQLRLLTADVQKTLQKLVAQGKAKVLNSPRITTLNHLKGTLSSTTTVPVSVGIKTGETSYAPLTFDTTDGKQLGHTTQFRTAFTPHINEATNIISLDLNISADDGINTYNANPQYVSANAKKGFADYGQTIWFHNRISPPLDVKLDVNNNQTILISGLSFPLFGLNENQDNVALFVTSRIVRRAE